MTALGTLQSSIIDFFDDVVSSGVLGPAPIIVDAGANIVQFADAAKLFLPLSFRRHESSVISSFSVQTDMERHRGSAELPVRRLDVVLNPQES